LRSSSKVGQNSVWRTLFQDLVMDNPVGNTPSTYYLIALCWSTPFALFPPFPFQSLFPPPSPSLHKLPLPSLPPSISSLPLLSLPLCPPPSLPPSFPHSLLPLVVHYVRASRIDLPGVQVSSRTGSVFASYLTGTKHS